MADIEQTPADKVAPGKQMITRDQPQGIGIDVGWRFGGLDIWWGNTRDAVSLRSLVKDARKRGYDFTLSEETEGRLQGKES